MIAAEHRAPWRGLLVAVLCVAAMRSGPAAAASAWERVSDDGALRVERRYLKDVDMYEVKVSTTSPFGPKAIFDVLWDQPSYPTFLETSKHIKILRDAGNERVVYEQLKMPVVKDRDYTTKCRYEHDAASGLYILSWSAANALGPPENPDHVRVKRTSGSWTLEPNDAGGSFVTYVVASESGGAVPTWIVNAAQKDAAPKYVRAILDRVAALAKR